MAMAMAMAMAVAVAWPGGVEAVSAAGWPSTDCCLERWPTHRAVIGDFRSTRCLVRDRGPALGTQGPVPSTQPPCYL